MVNSERAERNRRQRGVGRLKPAPALLHLQLRESAAHAHFAGAVGEEDYQTAVVLGGAAAGVGLVLGAQIEAGQKETRAGLPPRKTVDAGDAAVGDARHHRRRSSNVIL